MLRLYEIAQKRREALPSQSVFGHGKIALISKMCVTAAESGHS